MSYNGCILGNSYDNIIIVKLSWNKYHQVVSLYLFIKNIVLFLSCGELLVNF